MRCKWEPSKLLVLWLSVARRGGVKLVAHWSGTASRGEGERCEWCLFRSLNNFDDSHGLFIFAKFV